MPPSHLLRITEGNIDDNVVDTFQQWLESYLRYINNVDPQTARTSCYMHRDFWIAFPDVIFAMLSRR